MRIGNLSRKAVIAVLVGCTAYVACFMTNDEDMAYSEANDGRVNYYSLSIKELKNYGRRYGVTGAKELGSSAGITKLPESKAVKVTEKVVKAEKFLASLVEYGPEVLIRVAKKTFSPFVRNKVKEDINGVLMMEKGRGGLLGFLAGDVPSIIMPEHWKPDIKDRAIKIGNGVRGVFEALRGALCHRENESEDMREACKNSIVEMLKGVLKSGEERVSEIVTALNKDGIDDALRVFSSNIFGRGDGLKRVKSGVSSLDDALSRPDSSRLVSLVREKGIKKGSVDYPFTRIAIEMFLLMSKMAEVLLDSFLSVGGKKSISRDAARDAEEILFVLEVASAIGVDAIERKCSIEGSKSGQFELAGEDSGLPPFQYPGSGSGYSVSQSASQLYSSNPIPPPSEKNDGSYGYGADSKRRRVY